VLVNLLVPYKIIGVHLLASQGFYPMELVTIGNNHVNKKCQTHGRFLGAFLAIQF
jgi:hypothetical protein